MLTGHPVTKQLNISLNTIPQRNFCKDSKLADASYQPAVAAALRSRLADLDTTSTVSDLLPVGNSGSLFINKLVRYVLPPLSRGSVDSIGEQDQTHAPKGTVTNY